MTYDIRHELTQHIPPLRRYALSLTRDPADADDLVQACFERALVKADQFASGTSLRAWLFTILRSIFISNIRRAQLHGATVPMEDWMDGTLSGGQEQAIAVRDFMKCFYQLEHHHQEVLTLIGAAGLTYVETAAVLKVELGTIRSRLSRARKRLKELTNIADQPKYEHLGEKQAA